jgi:hypothetical protein
VLPLLQFAQTAAGVDGLGDGTLEICPESVLIGHVNIGS